MTIIQLARLSCSVHVYSRIKSTQKRRGQSLLINEFFKVSQRLNFCKKSFFEMILCMQAWSQNVSENCQNCVFPFNITNTSVPITIYILTGTL